MCNCLYSANPKSPYIYSLIFQNAYVNTHLNHIYSAADVVIPFVYLSVRKRQENVENQQTIYYKLLM